MKRDYEVMIQDVNPKNARIYFDGHMYVGGCRHAEQPRWFAPYFTRECEDSTNPAVPEVQEAGVSSYSRVFTVVRVPLKQLKAYPDAVWVDQQIRGHELWTHWERGLAAIAKRAREEPFKEKYDLHRLYFLYERAELGRTVKKAGQKQLTHGFGCSHADLREMRDLSDRGRP